MRDQYFRYLKALREHSICLIGTSQEKYTLQKYLEAMASRCLVFGELGDDPIINRFVVKSENMENPQEMAKQILLVCFIDV